MPELTHRYAPRGAARELLRSKDPEILLSGPAGTGKSRACLEKINLVCLRNAGTRALIVRKVRASLASTALVTWREHVVAELLLSGQLVYQGATDQRPAQFVYGNGSVVVVGGMDKATRIMSSEYDMIFVQEAIELTLDDWEALTTRLRNGRVSFQQIIGDTNPDRPTHWLKKRCDDGVTRVLESRHHDNPVLYSGDGSITPAGSDYMSKLGRLTGVRRARLRDGVWSSAEGMIYADEWDEAVHLVDPFHIPREWTRYWSVDFGYTHPFVCQWWAEDPDGRLYRYREIHMTGRTVDQHAATMLASVTDKEGEWWEPRPRAIVCDHDAEGREQLVRALRIRTTPARKKVREGIQLVQARLRPAGDGRPRLYLVRGATVEVDATAEEEHRPRSTEQEVVGYVWADGGKEEPVKKEDDGCDAMRYMVAYRDMRALPGVRFM